MVLSKKQTNAILLAVQEAGYESPDGISEVEEAQYWIGEAEKAWTAGAKDQVIQTILNLSPNGTPVRDVSAAENFLRGGVFEIESGLPIPKDVNEDPPDLPRDFTKLSDDQLRTLHSSYNYYLARVRWNLALAVNQLAAANHLKDEAYRSAYRLYSDQLIERGERPTKDLIDAFAREEDTYRTYDNDARVCQEKVTLYKTLVEIYGGNVDRLSREFTMRSVDYK